MAPTGVGGILAGQVLDSSNSRLPAIYVQVAESGTSSGAPIEVAADSQGYFTIQGLQPGRQYQLTARARDGNHMLAGMTVATPPNARLVIRMGADPGQNNPMAPSAPASSPPYNSVQIPPPAPSASWLDSTTGGADQAWAPGRNAAAGPNAGHLGAPSPMAPRRAAELGPPIGIPPAAQAGPSGLSPAPFDPVRAPSRISTPNIAEDSQARTHTDPSVEIHGPLGAPIASNNPAGGNPGGIAPLVAPPSGPAGWDSPPPVVDPFPVPARVPSCELVGQTLHNFALYDVNGQPWEFRQHHGKLVLVDFWGTWCIHCLHAIPHLKDMQLRYGPYGLEVIGIAYEEGTVPEQIQKVNRIRSRYELNYRVLMGSDRERCPVRTQFQVRSWPTLVLLDQQGRILWRGEGTDPQQMRELEIIIRQRLGLR